MYAETVVEGNKGSMPDLMEFSLFYLLNLKCYTLNLFSKITLK